MPNKLFDKCRVCFGLIAVEPEVIVKKKKRLCSECRFLYSFMSRQEKRDGKNEVGDNAQEDRRVDCGE